MVSAAPRQPACAFVVGFKCPSLTNSPHCNGDTAVSPQVLLFPAASSQRVANSCSIVLWFQRKLEETGSLS